MSTRFTKTPTPTLKLIPAEVVAIDLVRIESSGWPLKTAVRFSIAKDNLKVARLIIGRQGRGGFYAGEDGRFLLDAVTHGFEPGKYTISASNGETKVSATLVINKRMPVSPEIPREQIDKPAWRNLAFFESRFGHLGYVPEGARKTQVENVRALRSKHQQPTTSDIDIFLSRPLPGICNWTPMGPSAEIENSGGDLPAHSGRIRSIAISPAGSPGNRTIFIGTASSGIWRSMDSGETWQPVSDYAESPAIGALAIDPMNSNHILAGTGEYSTGGPGTGYYGRGVLRSMDGGDTWTLVTSGLTDRDEITRIVFDENIRDRIYLTSDTGVYESFDGGSTWNNIWSGSATDLLIRSAPNGSLVELTYSAFNDGVQRMVWGGGTWNNPASLDFPGQHGRVALSRTATTPANLWAVYANVEGSDIVAIKRSFDDGVSWVHLPLPANGRNQSNYNLFIQAHPSNTEIAYLGLVVAFRSDPTRFDPTGYDPDNPAPGSSDYWRSISDSGGDILHTDHHAMAFDPVNANHLYECNDGGIYRSEDGGDRWFHINHQIGSLQCYSMAHHPLHEAIALGGFQDNGGMFYTGTPAWLTKWWEEPQNAPLGGDGIITAIDPNNPRRMYFGEHGGTNGINRSDDAGRTWPVHLKKTFDEVLSRRNWFVPFILDPTTTDVCYMAGDRVYRSADGAQNWIPVSEEVNGTISTMSIHPTDSNILFIGTNTGNVYMVRRTGPTWDLVDMETIDLTRTGLPAGLWISSLQGDLGGNLWATLSSVLHTESTGEFSNDHVYFTTPNAPDWESRSAGLAQANPINTLTIDPDDDTKVYCSGDIGVFRWNHADRVWEPWDEGLPNVPVYQLQIHQPSRLMRATTFGRGVWERHLDRTSCPPVDLYFRDNILDTGRGTTPEGMAHPFLPNEKVWHWRSEDIKVDAWDIQSTSFQTSFPVRFVADYYNRIRHDNPRRELRNRFYLTIHNRGPFPATNVQLRAFFTGAHGGLPRLPDDFWDGDHPFDGEPINDRWKPVGGARLVEVIEPGTSSLVHWEWEVPGDANTHSCLLALATCDQEPLVSTSLDPDALVIAQKLVTLKNLHVVGWDGLPNGLVVFNFDMSDPNPYDANSDLEIHWGDLPSKTQIHILFERLGDDPALDHLDPGQRKLLGIEQSEEAVEQFAQLREDPYTSDIEFDERVAYTVTRPSGDISRLPGIQLFEQPKRSVAVRVILPHEPEIQYQFDIVQHAGDKLLGGSSYLVRPPR